MVAPRTPFFECDIQLLYSETESSDDKTTKPKRPAMRRLRHRSLLNGVAKSATEGSSILRKTTATITTTKKGKHENEGTYWLVHCTSQGSSARTKQPVLD
jgi:hypothetical protein